MSHDVGSRRHRPSYPLGVVAVDHDPPAPAVGDLDHGFELLDRVLRDLRRVPKTPSSPARAYLDEVHPLPQLLPDGSHALVDAVRDPPVHPPPEGPPLLHPLKWEVVGVSVAARHRDVPARCHNPRSRHDPLVHRVSHVEADETARVHHRGESGVQKPSGLVNRRPDEAGLVALSEISRAFHIRTSEVDVTVDQPRNEVKILCIDFLCAIWDVETSRRADFKDPIAIDQDDRVSHNTFGVDKDPPFQSLHTISHWILGSLNSEFK